MHPEVTVFLQGEDGPFQELLLRQVARGRVLQFAELLEGVAGPNPFRVYTKCPLYLRSVTELKSSVCLFINQRLEALNPFFLDALLAEATRRDCGLATGFSVGRDGTILHSGLVSNDEGELVDPLRGRRFDGSFVSGGNAGVRSVASIAPHFFAVSCECLAAAGGFSLLSPNGMETAVRALVNEAQKRELRLSVTSRAVATIQTF